jgi:DNA-binding response OmpR family regulator
MIQSPSSGGGQGGPGSEGVLLVSSAADRDDIARVLKASGIPVQTVEHMDTRQAVERPATMLLDLFEARVPDEAWGVVAQEGRRVGALPLMVLTASGRRADIGRAINLGADDAISRPICDSELVARARAVLRSVAAQDAHESLYQDASLKADFDSFSASFGGRTATLSALEARLLELFVRHPGRLLTQEEILREVWGESSEVSADQVKLYVSYLRRKLGMPPRGGPIHSVRGRGYRFDPPVATG